ncbi:LysR substrate-binding domain-containing protein [Corynebacterium breve]|uniref:Probable hydrogen peroxide-inducible genes activator n=1 Tax=Corynebacterium breve TaxID=3049799 RepID=A0ABY8VDG2_9CORY|nr:hydrogen peroxide-inducible genes activator [Corynebacterium breve]WIM66775.1 LysR substrate-binding domain-containing protein [Corynebacterium breve]
MSNKEYRPTLAQLRTFVTIAENKHFGTAANKLSISQPSLSQALVALETGLDVQLIERSTRKVIVTPIGEKLLPYAKATLEAADAFIHQSRGAHGDLTGPLTIGVIPTVAPYVLPELLRGLKDEFPELEPRIVEEQTKHLVTQLREGQLDVALMALPSDGSGLIDLPLYDERFTIVVPENHSLAGESNLGLQAMDQLDLLLLDDGHCLRDQVVDLCRAASINPAEAADSVTRASSLTTILQLVVAGLGTTLVPESALQTECTRPGLALATFDESVVAQRTIGLVYRSSSSRIAEYEKLGEMVKRAFERTLEGNKALAGA